MENGKGSAWSKISTKQNGAKMHVTRQVWLGFSSPNLLGKELTVARVATIQDQLRQIVSIQPVDSTVKSALDGNPRLKNESYECNELRVQCIFRRFPAFSLFKHLQYVPDQVDPGWTHSCASLPWLVLASEALSFLEDLISGQGSPVSNSKP